MAILLMIPNSARPTLKESQQKKAYLLSLALAGILDSPFYFQAGFLAVRLEVVPASLIQCLRSPLRNLHEVGDTPVYPAYFLLDAKTAPKFLPLLSSAVVPAERRTSSL